MAFGLEIVLQEDEGAESLFPVHDILLEMIQRSFHLYYIVSLVDFGTLLLCTGCNGSRTQAQCP